MCKIRSILVVSFFLLSVSTFSQKLENESYRIMFYNVENLFDTINDPIIRDGEFTPEGSKKWSSYRYWTKIKKIFQVIAAVGEQEPPAIIGLCEIENVKVLNNLVYNTPLSKYPYTVIHADSPDRRGIDVALLIRKDKVKLIRKDFVPVKMADNPEFVTRDILHAYLQIEQDSLHVFVNHWPSRYGGQVKSDPKRLRAAEMLAGVIDSVTINDAHSKVLVMGDFNDEPKDKSLQFLTKTSGLFNLSLALQDSCKCGSYKYRSNWNMIDQVLVSEQLLIDRKLHIKNADVKLYKADFLLIKDVTYGGSKPNRTYLGPRYVNGYSDHLPIFFDLNYEH